MTSGCEPVRPGCQAAFDRLGDEEGEYSVWMGQTGAPTPVVQVVKDGREVLAVCALAGQFLEEAAGVPVCVGVAVGCGNFMFPLIFAHFRALPPFRRGHGVRCGPGMGAALKPAPTCRRHGWVAGGRAHDFVLRAKRTYRSTGFPPVREWRLGAEISCSRSFPLISERCLHSGGGRLFAVAWYGVGFEPALTRPGHGWVAVELAADFVFCGHSRTSPGAGLVSACVGVAVGCGNFTFRLISAHFRALPPDRRGQAVLWDLVRRVETCLSWLGRGWVAGGRAPDFVLRAQPDIGLVPACAGVAVGCGNFLFPLISAHFRALAPVRPGQAAR